jgi:23S rRNA-/tRNA-specific pseudouridylate synthase
MDPSKRIMQIGIDDISVLRTGPGWLVAEKLVGLSVHNDPGRDFLSLLGKKIAAESFLQEAVDWRPGSSIAAVHRLDRDTSGILLVACRPDVVRYFAGQFANRKIKKRYTALLHGHLPLIREAPGKNSWQFPLSEAAGGRSDPRGRGPRKPSMTRYEVLAHTAHYTWTVCEPVTGRTHQIRRHAKLAGHPVVGDRRYGSQRALKYLSDRCNFNRLALHSDGITFQPPESEFFVTVCSRGAPVEIQRLFDDDSETT